MLNIGLPEIIVIVMILMVVFGASRLPLIGENLGRAVGKLKRSVDPSPGGGKGADRSGHGDGVEDAEIVDHRSRPE